MKHRPSDLISLFARHPVAANLLMLLMILSGIWAVFQLNTQFMPTFSVNYITIEVEWSGASAEDVERSITIPLEQELRSLDHLKESSSNSRLGSSLITLEFRQNSDMSQALEQVKERVSLVRDLPQDSESPKITKVENFEPVAKILLTGVENLQALRPLVYRYERELLERGIAKVEITGLPDQMIAIQIPTEKLAEMKVSLTQIAKRIRERSQDLPAGTIGRGDTSRQLRTLSQSRSVENFEDLPLRSDAMGRVLRLRDIAIVEKKSQDYEVEIAYEDKPAVELTLYRTENTDALAAADVMKTWIKETKQTLPQGLQLQVFQQTWKLLEERITLLLKNGLGGLLLILLLLFTFLNRRVAFWIAMGIPTSFLAAMVALYLLGNSINMVSLFAMIMTLGIIVDDTIVVGEESLTLLRSGMSPLVATEKGAKKMFAPIVASSLTTVCAFLPLLLVGDVMGAILRTIPIVVICVIFASLVECFLVLPGHLNQSFKKSSLSETSRFRQRFDSGFNYFRDDLFRSFVTKAIEYRSVTLSVAFASIILVVGLFAGERINFTFFPSPEGTIVFANVQFSAGTSSQEMSAYLKQMQNALWQVDNDNGHVVLMAASYLHKGTRDKGCGAQMASIELELKSPDNRETTNQQFIEAWRSAIKPSFIVENLVIAPPQVGPPGKDIDILLSSESAEQLKLAALAIKDNLQRYTGVSDVEDDLPYGQEQLLFDLNAQGKSLELTIEDVGRQLRAAFTGELVQVYHEAYDETEVRVLLPESERHALKTLEEFPLVTPQGQIVPLYSVVDIQFRRGFDKLLHTDGRLTLHVTAVVDTRQGNANNILKELSKEALPMITEKYSVHYTLKGRALEQAETLRDMKYGLMLGLTLIYIILAWVFASYGWPVIVMIAIPFGLVGAILGHWFLGYDLTILSLFGLFGLSGIVINDSIILISTYKRLRPGAVSSHAAIVDASCQRLRAVLLTSMTTIVGLMPLLFETSLQAQFLIPMAISITFGLAFATILILIVVPVFLSVYEDCVG